MSNIKQLDLWHDSPEEAYRAAVDAIGGPKRVASELWPSKRLADAQRYLLHCLDPERPEKLAMEEMDFIGQAARRAGCHVIAAYWARSWGYQDPVPVDPEDEATRLRREYVDAVKSLGALASRMERLEGVA
jgi:hypothetical protein